MPASKLDARFLLASASEGAHSLKAEINRLRGKEYAFDLPVRILEVLDDYASDTIAALVKLNDDAVTWHPQTPVREQIDSIQTHSAQVAWIHGMLTLLERVDSSRVPFEVVRVFEQHASELLGTGPVRLLLKPTHKFNYRVLDLRKVFKKRRGGEQPKLGECFVLSFPSADASSVLLHTLFLHELGHPLYQRRLAKLLDDDLVQALKDAENALSTQIEEDVAREMRVTGLDRLQETDPELAAERATQFRSFTIFEATKIARAWVEEIVCDFSAIRQAGPAYMAAFCAFIVPFFSTNNPSATHPDLSLRLNLARHFTDEQASKSPVFKELYDLHFEFDPNDATAASTDGNIARQLAHQILRCDPENPLLKRLVEIVLAEVPNPLDLPGFRETVTEALKGLDSLIPPDPFLYGSSPSTSGAVIAFVAEVAWIFKRSDFGAWGERYDWDSRKKADILNQLALKALEAAELKRRYAGYGEVGDAERT